MVSQFPHLKALDDFIITDEETLTYTSPSALRFRALSPQYMKIYLPKFLENHPADQHLFNMEVDIYRIKRLFERNSPSIRIQSLWRGYFYRSKAIFSYAQKKKAAIKIQKMARGWLYRLRVKKELKNILKQRDLDYLLMSQNDFVKFRAITKIERAMYNYLRKKRKQNLLYYSSTLLQANYRAKHTKHSSFQNALGLDKDFRIFFLKEQKMDFIRILKKVLEDERVPQKVRFMFNFERLKEFIKIDNEYQMIRYPNPLTFQRHELPILALCTPSSKCRVKYNHGLSKLIKGGQSVSNLYTRFKGMDEEKQILQKLRKIFCHCSDSDARYLRKTKHQYKLKKVFDNYQELLVFQSPSKQLSFYLCQHIYKNNLDPSHEIFLPFFPKVMNQISACISIQQSFRSYQIRKQQKLESPSEEPLIKPLQETTFAQCVIQHRAALAISQWWKYFKLRQRIKALADINQYLYQIDSSTLYMEEAVYLNLGQILDSQSKSFKFLEQHLTFDFKPSKQSPNQQSLDVSTLQLPINDSPRGDQKTSDENSYNIVIQNQSEMTERFKDIAFPKWLVLQIEEFNKHRMSFNTFSIWQNQYQGIIHKGVQGENQSKVLDFNEIVDPYRKKMSLSYGLNFISMQFNSTSEAKKRALLIGVLTYSMRSKSFVHVFTKNSLADMVFLKSLYRIWREYELLDVDERVQQLMKKSDKNAADLQILRDKQRRQQHQGLVLSLKDRWQMEGININQFVEVKKPEPIGIGFRRRDDYEVMYVEMKPNNRVNQVELNINQPRLVQEEIGGGIIADPNLTNYNSILHSSNLNDQSIDKDVTPKLISKEPISNLKNISLKEIPLAANRRIGQQIGHDTVNLVPNSNKSVTAYPSSRYTKGQLQQKQENFRRSIEFFNNRKSSMNSPSTMPNSNEQTPFNNLPNLKFSQFHNQSTRDNTQNNKNFSAIVSRKASSVFSINSINKISDIQNTQLLQEQKQLEEEQRVKHKQLIELDRLQRRFDVAKVKQINQIMKQVVKFEQEANKDMYSRFNKEEKDLIQQLLIKEKEKQDSEIISKRLQIQHHRDQKAFKQEQKDFANNFSQIRNMISKQSQMGQLLKHKLGITKENRQRVQEVRDGSQRKLLQPLVSTQFDSTAAIRENILSTQARKRVYPMTAQHSPRDKTLIEKKQLNNESFFNQEQKQPQVGSSQDTQVRMFDFGIGNSLMGSRLFPPNSQANTASAAAKTRILYKLSFIEESYPLNQSAGEIRYFNQ